MKIAFLETIYQLNPWLSNPQAPLLDFTHYLPRVQTTQLLAQEWDTLWTVLVGPRQAGKTTLGKFLCAKLIEEKRFNTLLYLNCDFPEIRQEISSPRIIPAIIQHLKLASPILFLDEVQRLENPGLLMKAIADLKLPVKLLASGSSQLEIKSKVQEHLTGRHLESIILPMSFKETAKANPLDLIIFGCYPQIVQTQKKAILLKQLYSDYITRDIVEFLKIGKPDILEKLVGLIAHSSGQLVNYNQLATDCGISVITVQNYLSILEKTYTLQAIKPFVGNKRTEITSNPIYYFIDNGFRNQALKNFAVLEQRTDNGLLIQSFIFQEIYKLQTQHFKDFNINFWRTKSGAEVDFILHKNNRDILPIEVKYRSIKEPKVTRGFRSFLQAYQPKEGIFITKDFIGDAIIENCHVHFIPLSQISDMLTIIQQLF